MQIIRNGGNPDSRYAIVIDKRGITTAYQRTSTYGGFYTKDGITFPWPWIKVS